MRKPKDRDFIRTTEDMLFCVVGYVHPPDRLLAYLKYIPSEKGLWASGSLHFERMIAFYSSKSVSGTFSFLRERCPKYLFYSPVNRITFPAVPYSEMKQYFEPERKLKELVEKRRELDALQLRAVELAEYISATSGTALDKFGVTGSILLGIHNISISDVDLTVYGQRSAMLVKQALIQEYDKSASPMRRLTKRESEEWCKKKTRQFSISHESAKQILKKKWNFGFYKEKAFSIHPTKLDSEITEKYGEPQYIGGETAEIIATVEDSTQAVFNPSTYRVTEVRILRGPEVADIEEVVSFEGVFSDIAAPDEKIKAKGKLELVANTRTGGKYHRVVVGSNDTSSPEYILIAT